MPLSAPAVSCPACRVRAPAFEAARAATLYTGPARDALMTFKIGGERRAAGDLARMMRGAIAELAPDLITFVPATRRSLAERGFNPAAELARHLGVITGRPVRPLLAKMRETRDQAALSAARRRMNQDGAYRAARAPGAHRIALVDDIITTGATADACASALRGSGAAAVVVVAFARTP